MQPNHNDIDNVLSRRASPPDMQDDLAERIIYTAVNVPKVYRLPLGVRLLSALKPTIPRVAMMTGIVVLIVATAMQFQNMTTNEKMAQTNVAEVHVSEDWAMVLDVYNEDLFL